MGDLAEAFVDATLKLTRENFDKKQNPAGIPWRRRKKDQPWPLMVKTGKLRGSFRRGRGGKHRAEVLSMDPKAKFHQHGTKKMPRRQMLPGKQIPSRYSRAYSKIARKKIMGVLLGKIRR
jgi:phage gpG-like protein